MPTPNIDGITINSIDLAGFDAPGIGKLYTIADRSWAQTWEVTRATTAQDPVNGAIIYSGLVILQPHTTTLHTFATDPPPLALSAFAPHAAEWFPVYDSPDSPFTFTWGLGSPPGDQGGVAPLFDPNGPPYTLMSTAVGTLVFNDNPAAWAVFSQWYYYQPTLIALRMTNHFNEIMYVNHQNLKMEWFLKLTLQETPPPWIPPPAITPPDPPGVTSPPTGNPPAIVNPTAVPPGVQQRLTLEKQNPGMTMDITRNNITRDVVQVFLGQKVLVTAESYGNLLGLTARAHVITQCRFQGKASSGEHPAKNLKSQFRLEKIPGTLLPGAGTSTPAQSQFGADNPGVELGMYHRLNVNGTGLNLGRLAPS